MNPAFFIKFAKFALVGCSGLAVDFGVTFLCKEILRVNKYVANSLGFACAASSNYFLNRWWTFNSNDPDMTRQYAYFFAIALAGLAINNFLVWLLHDRLKLNFAKAAEKLNLLPARFLSPKLDFYAAKLLAILCVTLWNFAGNYFFTFSM
ncbi:MAG: GtrA family protein [Prevotellaceae bacterium]|jgi:putative flippase GtrA|nr:GtrA family protein [Prevotellaceae bacterium]